MKPTPEQEIAFLAQQHADWFDELLEEQHQAQRPFIKRLMYEFFIHGAKHMKAELIKRDRC